MSNFSYKKHLDFLRGVSNYFNSTTDPHSRNFCDKHGIEHIGKTAYSIAIDLFLHEEGNDEEYLNRARQRAMRVVSRQFEVEGRYVYLPDGNEKWNMSQRVIDAGAATDMLATFLLSAGSKLAKEERESISSVVYKNADTYLTEASVEKAPTNQRLWGATGLASAYTLFKKPEWAEALRSSVSRSLSEMRGDGSFPYVTAYEGYGMDSSAKDITPYYHSRHVVFLWHVLDSLGGDQAKEIHDLLLATDFLIGLYQADGLKNIALETKHWYFLSPYEVASNSYDAYAFLRAYRQTGEDKYAHYALLALNHLYRHQQEDGSLIDHYGSEVNFQCKYFWNSHCAWLTRIADDVKNLEKKSFTPTVSHNCTLAPSGIVNVNNGAVAFILRGAKTPRRVIMGPMIGGGSLVYFGTKEMKFTNLLQMKILPSRVPGNFHLTETVLNPGYWWRIRGKDLKALLIYARIELRAFSISGFLQRMRIVWQETFSLKNHASSMYVTDVKIEHRGATINVSDAGLARRDGKKISGYSLERIINYSETAIVIQEKIIVTAAQKGSLVYVLPDVSSDLELSGTLETSVSKRMISISSGQGVACIKYCMKA
ncbi:hypothetical protein H6786_02765 [Candidatus Nomurabacteria bacterium]|nr:hypothetical protein [Candidatus Nomurabacteria bacterium]